MKAILFTAQSTDKDRRLKLRLTSEGASDRVVLQLLSEQYPMIGCQDDYWECVNVPIADPLDLPSRSQIEIQEGPFNLDDAPRSFLWKSKPWEFTTLRAATLQLESPEDWEIKSVKVGGRACDATQLLDVHLGMTVEIVARRTSSAPKGLCEFRGTISARGAEQSPQP